MAIELEFKKSVKPNDSSPSLDYRVKIPVVDPKPVKDYYLQNGIELGVLQHCNSQEYRMIGGYGSGFFLLTNKPVKLLPDESPPDSNYPNEINTSLRALISDATTAKLFLSDNRESLPVISRNPLRIVKVHSISVPYNLYRDRDATGSHYGSYQPDYTLQLLVLETAEPKWELHNHKLNRVFNRIQFQSSNSIDGFYPNSPLSLLTILEVICRDIRDGQAGPFLKDSLLSTQEPEEKQFDVLQETDIQQFLNEFLENTAAPLDLDVRNISAFEAIEYLCRSYCLGWTYDTDKNKLVVLPFIDDYRVHQTRTSWDEQVEKAIEHQTSNALKDKVPHPEIRDNIPVELWLHFPNLDPAGNDHRMGATYSNLNKQKAFEILQEESINSVSGKPAIEFPEENHGRIEHALCPNEYVFYKNKGSFHASALIEKSDNRVELALLYYWYIQLYQAAAHLKNSQFQGFVDHKTSKPLYHTVTHSTDNLIVWGFPHQSIIYQDLGDGPFTIWSSHGYPVIRPSLSLPNRPGSIIQGVIHSVYKENSEDSPFYEKYIAVVTVRVVPCTDVSILGLPEEQRRIRVVDWSGCILDEASLEQLPGLWIWATLGAGPAYRKEDDEESDTITACHWTAINRCCPQPQQF